MVQKYSALILSYYRLRLLAAITLNLISAENNLGIVEREISH